MARGLIEPYRFAHRDDVLSLRLSFRAWAPVMLLTRRAVPGFVYDAFYPEGWDDRQLTDLAAVLDGEPENVDVAVVDGMVAGWVCNRLHPEDRMGEVHVLAVDPDHQRCGVGTALLEHSFERARAAGMAMTMVETGDDPGHAPGRAVYERSGFVRWPVARYFKSLHQDTTEND